MRIPRLPVETTPTSVGLDYKDAFFMSRDDNVLLKGWFIHGSSQISIIIVHGGFQNRVDDNVDTLGLARDLNKAGYNLLLFDLRGRGESEGTGRALSNIGKDIGGAFDYIRHCGYAADSTAIVGYCSGAASACIFASQEDIGALVLVGCFAEVGDMVVSMATSQGIPRMLAEIFIPGLKLTTRVLYDYQVVNPIDVVSGVSCPIFFIHEEHDEFIQLEDMRRLFEKSSHPENQFWEVDNTEHSQSYKKDPTEFTARITSFLETTLLNAY
ncbi:MAG: alpha/beta hydrolase [Dehalococcoidia bacterium]|nr:MAG: alpha/beta hydrolase [Dehalococcoidia bacterium]